MNYEFDIVDVFTEAPFGGNQLAVFPNASGISAEGMQILAREFNFAESTFVFPPKDARHTCRVRIFTPRAEVAFAGHPTIGTAAALMLRDKGPSSVQSRSLVLEENVGPVQVEVESAQGRAHATLTLHTNIEQPGHAPSRSILARALMLNESEVMSCWFASVGLRFCFVHLATRAAVDRAVLDRQVWSQNLADEWSPNIYFFAGDLVPDGELYARMFAPALGIEEDPATGSACAALVGVAAGRSDQYGDIFRLSAHQGVQMGRPSSMVVSARKTEGRVSAVSLGGSTVHVANGTMYLPERLLSKDR